MRTTVAQLEHRAQIHAAAMATPVHLAFRGRLFRTSPTVRLSWAALSSGLQAFNERHDQQPPNRKGA